MALHTSKRCSDIILVRVDLLARSPGTTTLGLTIKYRTMEAFSLKMIAEKSKTPLAVSLQSLLFKWY